MRIGKVDSPDAAGIFMGILVIYLQEIVCLQGGSGR